MKYNKIKGWRRKEPKNHQIMAWESDKGRMVAILDKQYSINNKYSIRYPRGKFGSDKKFDTKEEAKEFAVDWMKDHGKEGVKFWTEQLENSPFQIVGDNGEPRVEMR